MFDVEILVAGDVDPTWLAGGIPGFTTGHGTAGHHHPGGAGAGAGYVRDCGNPWATRSDASRCVDGQFRTRRLTGPAEA